MALFTCLVVCSVAVDEKRMEEEWKSGRREEEEWKSGREERYGSGDRPVACRKLLFWQRRM